LYDRDAIEHHKAAYYNSMSTPLPPGFTPQQGVAAPLPPISIMSNPNNQQQQLNSLPPLSPQTQGQGAPTQPPQQQYNRPPAGGRGGNYGGRGNYTGGRGNYRGRSGNNSGRGNYNNNNNSGRGNYNNNGGRGRGGNYPPNNYNNNTNNPQNPPRNDLPQGQL